MTRYLRHVQRVWLTVGDPPGIDFGVVNVVQGRCPRFSSEDRQFLAKQRFNPLWSRETRTAFLLNLEKLECTIPSLHTFLEDTKYLEPCAKILKSILPRPFKGSVNQCFEALYNGNTELKVQVHEFAFVSRIYGLAIYASWWAYRQLWAFAFRHFPEMIGQIPRKDIKKPKPVHPNIQRQRWYDLTQMAVESGYEGIRQQYLDLHDADVEMAEEFLKQARPTAYSDMDERERSLKVQHLCQFLKDFTLSSPGAPTAAELTSDSSTCGQDVATRCGRPYEQSFLQDQRYLFLDHIYIFAAPIVSRKYITSFFVKYCTFKAFFGEVPDETPSNPTLVGHGPPANLLPLPGVAAQASATSNGAMVISGLQTSFGPSPADDTQMQQIEISNQAMQTHSGVLPDNTAMINSQETSIHQNPISLILPPGLMMAPSQLFANTTLGREQASNQQVMLYSPRFVQDLPTKTPPVPDGWLLIMEYLPGTDERWDYNSVHVDDSERLAKLMDPNKYEIYAYDSKNWGLTDPVSVLAYAKSHNGCVVVTIEEL